ncbi:hypothetical protein TWF679_007551 [Orbilia oligospora]|uniref:GST N-terminal domain-containing protein n=1 Tax=Orbilia oligospora TaxID=2813651 RepID=A0A8H8V7C1_ORBOL|nr:hypothetical protein TWF679_007551 [Orbilia oligospora]
MSIQGLISLSWIPVPALVHGGWGCYESTVLMEYVDDISEKKLLPEDPKQKAYSRLWADHISRNIVPTFYRYLQAQEVEKQAEYGREFEKQVNTLLEAADPKGPFFARIDQTLAKWQRLSTRAEDCLEKGLPGRLNLKNA